MKQNAEMSRFIKHVADERQFPVIIPCFSLTLRQTLPTLSKSPFSPGCSLLSTCERLTCSKSRHCHAQLLYGVFQGTSRSRHFRGVFTSSDHVNRNALAAQNNEAQGQGNRFFAIVNSNWTLEFCYFQFLVSLCR